MDVRCAPWVGDRLDGAEPEVAARISAINAVSLKTRIALGIGATVGMVIHGVAIALPDLDYGTGNRLAATIDNASHQEDGNALAEHPIAVDRQQVGVGVRWPFCGIARIKRSERLRRRGPDAGLGMA
jgi:hypothetical protein